jgi:3-hydroxymyristoyl/3-hydroxydecanoyl-(acyl carrier protein) dehydratase
MNGHFCAFSFVDRITAIQPGVCIRGGSAIPSGLDAFPASLVAEAVGQLAAWAAMAAVNFERRPVAGIAGSIELLSAVRPGQVLELAAELESVDAEAVAYGGTARADGVPVIQLQQCVGPMLPLEEFDDPQAVRDRFALLCGPGAVPGGFRSVAGLALDRTDGEAGQRLRATLQVPPASAVWFADHFPRRPVFPGSLLMHANLQLAAALTAELTPPAAGGRWVLRTVSDVKLRAFILPGETLEIEARLGDRADNTAGLTVETRRGKKMIGGARVRLSTEKQP